MFLITSSNKSRTWTKPQQKWSCSECFSVANTITKLDSQHKHGIRASTVAFHYLDAARLAFILSDQTAAQSSRITFWKCLERTGNNSNIHLNFTCCKYSMSPHTNKDRLTAEHILQSASGHERKWQKHLPLMLIKVDLFSILSRSSLYPPPTPLKFTITQRNSDCAPDFNSLENFELQMVPCLMSSPFYHAPSSTFTNAKYQGRILD